MLIINELLDELKEYGIENRFEVVSIHSSKITLLMKTIEEQQEEIQRLETELMMAR